MRPLAAGLAHRLARTVEPDDTAAALGNAGVDALATTTLILWIETAADAAIRPALEPGEGSVGTRVCVDHLDTGRAGEEVEVRVEVSGVDGRRITFAAEARSGERVLMTGKHERVVVDLARFRARLARR